MKIKSEWKLLDAIREKIEWEGIRAPVDLAVSIGDDAAVFDIDDDTFGLLTTDISIEDVHFRRGLVSPGDIGYKAMMGNISDITAMGGTPLYAVVSIGIPGGFSQEKVLALYDGLIDAANPAGVAIAGGDISGSEVLVVNIALYGKAAKRKLLKRKGAGAGNIIYVTGTIGDSMAGLEILLSKKPGMIKKFPGLVGRHKRPSARFDIINDIINVFRPTAMIDISDGLLSDIRHICEAGSTGFRIIEESIPVSGELASYAAGIGKDPFQYALSGGEEYELLFTSGKKLADMMKMTMNGIPVTNIGEITPAGFFIERNGVPVETKITGYDHFKKGKK